MAPMRKERRERRFNRRGRTGAHDWLSICSASGTTAAGQWEPSFSRKRRQTR
jgi:hypothetical protein